MAELIDRLRDAVADRYRVERELGHGGMATVFLAEDLKHRRPVAIKVLDPEIAGQLGPERFVREIETAARLQHPHILPLLDSGAEAGLFFYVMPFVEGDSLRQRLARERQLPVEEAVRLAAQIARALDHAHRRGVVHRDIKPENVLLADGEAVIADFGIAAAIEQSGGEKLTQSGFTVGTPGYMSPEQFAGSSEVDGRSDLYSLGCTLYELLTGQPPFSGPIETLARQHLNLAPRPVRDLRPTVSPEIADVVGRALAKLPADRPATGADFATALTGVVRTPTPDSLPATAPMPAGAPTSAPTRAVEPAAPATSPATPAAAAPSTRRGSPWLAIAVVAAVVVAAIAGTMMWRAKSRPAPSTVGVAAQRRWVWLAEFEGPASDPSLGAAARDLVTASFDASKELATVPDEQVRLALRNAGKPDSSALTPALSRELAFRNAIPVVIEGTVRSIGSGYTIALRATRAEDGAVVHGFTGEAASDKDLIPELTRLAREMRRSLGENAEAFRGNEAWADAPTPSLEAFKLYRAGRRKVSENEDQAAVALLRQAVSLDPEFATAWAYLGTAFGNMDLVDSAQAARLEALRHPNRLTPVRRLYIEAMIASTRRDPQTAIARYDALLTLNPPPLDRLSALINRSGALQDLGRAEEALASMRTAAEVSPIATVPTVSLNIADLLYVLNRSGEARTTLGKPTSVSARLLLAEIDLKDRRWASADSLATDVLSAGPLPAVYRGRGDFIHASIRMLRGRFDEADAMLATVFEGDLRSRAAGARWGIQEALALARGSAPRYPASENRSDSWSVATRAFTAARSGDAARARSIAAAWPDSMDGDGRAMLDAYVEGVLAGREEQWNRVVEVLAPPARRGFRRVPGVDAMMRPAARLRVADAFDHLGQPDSAIAYLELVLHPPAEEPPAHYLSPTLEPFVRRKWMHLAIRAGRMAEAEQQWALLSESCTQPDAGAQRFLDETRSELQAARGVEAGGRR